MPHAFHNCAPLKGWISGLAAFPIAFSGLSAPVTGSTCPTWYPAPTPTSPTRNNSIFPLLQKPRNTALGFCLWFGTRMCIPLRSSTAPVTVRGQQDCSKVLQEEWVRGTHNEVHGRTQPTASHFQGTGAGINSCLIQELAFLPAEKRYYWQGQNVKVLHGSRGVWKL